MVLFVGRLVEKKGVPIVLDVCRRLPAVQFVVAGDGPLRTLFSAPPANLMWHRTVPQNQIHGYYRATDCVLLPSHGEGLPLVVQEAMACGLPVVIADDEPYADGLVAAAVCVSAPRQPHLIVRRIQETLEGADPAIGQRARTYAEEHWSLRAMIARYVALFESLLGRA